MQSAPTTTRQGSHQQYDWLREDDVMVAMRDGARLAADIYRPALDGEPAPGPFPVILERTPYNKRRLDLTAKLLDVYPANADEPDGYAMNIADSIIRARYRADRARAGRRRSVTATARTSATRIRIICQVD